MAKELVKLRIDSNYKKHGTHLKVKKLLSAWMNLNNVKQNNIYLDFFRLINLCIAIL